LLSCLIIQSVYVDLSAKIANGLEGNATQFTRFSGARAISENNRV